MIEQYETPCYFCGDDGIVDGEIFGVSTPFCITCNAVSADLTPGEFIDLAYRVAEYHRHAQA